MSRVIELISTLMLNDRFVSVVDSLLLCLGYAGSIAVLAPALAKVRRDREMGS